MDESIWVGVLIVCALVIVGMWDWAKTECRKQKARKLEKMKRQKVLGSSERHIDLKG
jgi:FtsZ-interacting cell division protein ZipA